MLENSIWTKYHKELNINKVISDFYGLEPLSVMSDEKELYAELKRKLTKKELRLFIMLTAKVADTEIMEQFDIDAESLQKMKDKLLKKMRNDNVKRAFKTTAAKDDIQDEDE